MPLDRDQLKRIIATTASMIYEGMTDSERHGVRFGMFPAKLMQAANAAVLENFPDLSDYQQRDLGVELSSAIMRVAEQRGKPALV